MANVLDPHNAFIAALVEKLSQEPSVSFNPHCLSERTLFELFDAIMVQGHRPQSSKEQTKEWLEEIQLLAAIVMDEYPEKPVRSTKFYSLDISRKTLSQVSPLELLQAYDENGVICYFTAVAFHSLTTQPPTHHHVAIPSHPRAKPSTNTPKTRKETQPTRRKADPLGTWLFSHKGLRYYKTTREQRLIPGIQTRFFSPTALVRITTLEQTLLDTLHRPLSCGGPAVVMEAWEQGISRANEDKLASHLHQMNHLPVAQRLGYILGNINHKPGLELKKILEDHLTKLDPADRSMYQQLFPGLEYTHLQHPWLIYGPT